MVEIWYGIFWFMLAAYAVLDGRNFGAAALRLVVAANAAERRQVMDAIGPLWTWHEVWLVAAAGVLLLAFPAVLAAAFAGYYLALFLVLWLLVLRGVSMEVGGHLTHPLWQTFWDVVLTASSALLTVLLGVALGNIVRGVPLDRSGEFHLPFFTDFIPRGHVGLLDWYTISIGALSVAVLCAHGATYLTLRTTGAVHARSRTIARRLWLIALGLGCAVCLETCAVRPDLGFAFVTHPLALAFLGAALGGASALISGFLMRRDGRVYDGSCILIAGLLGARAAASFPVMLHSTLNAEESLTAYRTASPPAALSTALAWWVPAVLLALLWAALVRRSYRGLVPTPEISEGSD